MRIVLADLSTSTHTIIGHFEKRSLVRVYVCVRVRVRVRVRLAGVGEGETRRKSHRIVKIFLPGFTIRDP